MSTRSLCVLFPKLTSGAESVMRITTLGTGIDSGSDDVMQE